MRHWARHQAPTAVTDIAASWPPNWYVLNRLGIRRAEQLSHPLVTPGGVPAVDDQSVLHDERPVYEELHRIWR